jgi:copper transport protein
MPEPACRPTGRASRRPPAWLVAALSGVLLVLSVVVGAGPAQAHAVLVSSTPAAGARLGATPGTVTLVFDEPLVPTLSRASVVGPAGTTDATVTGKTMSARLRGNSPGVYRVEWKTVSQIDGHTITGSFRFGVGVAVTGAGSAPGPVSDDFVLAALRGVEYALLLLMCGVALLDRLGRDLPLRQPVVAGAAALLLSGLVVVAGESVVASSGLSASGAAAYLSNGLTGWARVARLLLELALLVVAVARRRPSVLLLVGICGAVAVSGHGADVEPAWQGMVVNAGHLLAAGVWAGGIMALGVIRWRGRWAEAGAAVLPRFSRVAPWAFAVSVGFGAIQAVELLGSPQPLIDTDYGLVLVAKGIVIAAMVPLSLLAWRRARLHVRAEAALALLVVAAAAALAAFPVVPKEAREAAAEAATPPPVIARSSAFPASGDLTLGGRAGSVMVALTLRPGRSGRNIAHVYLADPATGASTARIRVGAGWQPMTPCGVRCRTGRVLVGAHDRVSVAVSGPRAGTARFVLPELPAPDGSALMRRATRRMAGLDSYRVAENLSGFRTSYTYARPHRMYARTWFGDGPVDTLWLGRTVYRRTAPSTVWKLRSQGVLAPVPYFVWNPFLPFEDVHVLGRTTLAGTRVQVLSLFAGHAPDPEPVWFTLYVDPVTGLVVRSQMWAPNHFMKDRYYAINRPVSLPSPRS